MDVLQTLSMNTSAKGSGAKDVSVEDIDWETFFDSSPKIFSTATHVAQIEDPEIVVSEDPETVSVDIEPVEMQSGEVLNEDATVGSDLPVAVSVQEYSTTFEKVPALVVTAIQDIEKTATLDKASTSGTLYLSNSDDVIEGPVQVALTAATLPKMADEVEIKAVEARLNVPVEIKQNAQRETPLPLIDEHKPKDLIDPFLNRVEKNTVIEKSDAIVRSYAGLHANSVQSHIIDEVVDPMTKISRSSDVATPELQRPVGVEIKEIPVIERLLPSVAGLDPRVAPTDSFMKSGEISVPSQITQPTQSIQASATIPSANVIVRDQPVLMQVSQAIEATESGKIELRLDPAELGKVRITMSARDGFMHATIMAERPETLELLRRNSESLDMTFAEQGFDQSQLSFEQFDEEDRSDRQAEEGLSFDMTASAEEKASPAILSQIAGGLDIKL